MKGVKAALQTLPDFYSYDGVRDSYSREETFPPMTYLRGLLRVYRVPQSPPLIFSPSSTFRQSPQRPEWAAQPREGQVFLVGTLLFSISDALWAWDACIQPLPLPILRPPWSRPPATQVPMALSPFNSEGLRTDYEGVIK